MSDEARDAQSAEKARLRDLTSRLGFGDGITEPQADNDTIVAWFEEQGREADEWREHEHWRDDCYAAGHDPLNDCDEHGPTCCNRPHAPASAAASGLMSDQQHAEKAVQQALHDVWLAIHNRRFEDHAPDSVYRGIQIAEAELRRYCSEHGLHRPSCPVPCTHPNHTEAS